MDSKVNTTQIHGAAPGNGINDEHQVEMSEVKPLVTRYKPLYCPLMPLTSRPLLS